jgi:hypothetical protein
MIGMPFGARKLIKQSTIFMQPGIICQGQTKTRPVALRALPKA